MPIERDIEQLLDQLHQQRNFDFHHYKRATLRRRVERRMQERKCSTVHAYLALLERDPDEYTTLISTMLIKMTSFLRDPEVWQELEKKVLPELIERRLPAGDLRVWCAGCATGEEAYTVAILLAERLAGAPGKLAVKVFGTDLDPGAIAFCRRGVYSAEAVKPLGQARIQRWFQQTPEGFVVRQELRRIVVFGINNLVSDAPISRLDLLLCRNVFIYLDATLQKRVLSRFHYALRQSGVLVLGKSELIPYAARLFESIDLTRRVYRKDGRHEGPPTTHERLLALIEEDTMSRIAHPTHGELGEVTQFHRGLLGVVDVPLIATTVDGTVTYVNEAATRLWGVPEAQLVGRRLQSLGVEGLTGDLLVEKSDAVRRGRTDSETAIGRLARGPDGQAVHLEITVRPLRDGTKELQGLVYTARDVTSLRAAEHEVTRLSGEGKTTAHELQVSNEELQSSNEELETTNEELQSANEELQTTNEELQSTNEELETTNEELQSTNAELDTTNRELAARTEELNLLSFYQRTIIRSLAAGVVVLDPQGRITMWNLAAERLLGITEGEATAQLFWTLRVPALTRALVARIRRSLAKNLALRVDDISYELPSGGRGHATLAAVPLLDVEANLGAVIIFEDITRAVTLTAENVRLRERKKP